MAGKAVVFGASGQDGYYLIEQLARRAVEAVGVSRSGEGRRGDVARLGDVEAILRDVRPQQIFHLAARSTTRHDALFENHETISTGTLNVLECARRDCPDARVFITGSGVQFRNDGAPIDEETPFEASSPYAVARIQSVYAARYYRSLGLKAYVGYLFHHDSPRRGASHLSALIAGAAQRIGAGSPEVLELGDVSVVKEWTFAGDVTEGMLALLSADRRLRGGDRVRRRLLRRAVAGTLLRRRGPPLARSRPLEARLPRRVPAPGLAPRPPEGPGLGAGGKLRPAGDHDDAAEFAMKAVAARTMLELAHG